MKKAETEEVKKVEAPKTVEQPKPTFKSVNMITLQPKSLPFQAYHLVNLNPESLEDLIKVLGKAPKVTFNEGKINYSYGSKLPYLFANAIIRFDTLGNIQWIESAEKINTLYTNLTEKK